MKKIAIIYSGFLGNINRTINSLIKHCTKDIDIDIFIATRTIKNNMLRIINKHTFNIRYVNVTYDINISNIKNITEINSNDDICDECKKEINKFKNRTKGYVSKLKNVDNYDTTMEIIFDEMIPSVFEQYFLIDLCIRNIIKVENKENFKYSHIIRTRDRYTFNKDILISDDISLLGHDFNPIFMLESFIIGSRNNMILLLKNYYEKIGNYRATHDWNFNHIYKIKDGDHTFSAETQFTLHLLSIFDKKYIHMLNIEPYSYQPINDSYGKLLINNEDEIELEYCVY